MSLTFTLLERDLIPDPLIRLGIRQRCARVLREEGASDNAAAREARKQRLIDVLRAGPLAIATDEANEQHYELPTSFFQHVLGRHLKYSSAYWPEGVDDLDAAERAMLDLYFERAQLADGQRILELGCGWGSMTLAMAERLPQASITGVSNSATQRTHILAEAEARGLSNVEIITCDMNDLGVSQPLDGTFDRVVSIEMFEHMRNYRTLFERISGWLADDGRLFVHIFCHKDIAYPFEVRDENDWMARYFFTGGMMPSADLLPRMADAMEIEERWMVNGAHYQKTAEAWLANMDAQRAVVMPILEGTYGSVERRRWWVYWRVFFLACAELFGFRSGEEWQVAHYRFRRRA
ncbi:MAG: cyclopropane-fatty-acyl-phospholipid synthase family protein [Acidobacteriota bacterium]